MKLRRNERCPVHGRMNCCGRERFQTMRQARKYQSFEPGVRRVVDEHHPRGYREIRSAAALRRLLNRKIVEQERICALCEKEFTEYQDIVADHVEPRGMGSARRDDHPENIQAVHRLCNQEKGSQRNYGNRNRGTNADKVSNDRAGEDQAFSHESAKTL